MTTLTLVRGEADAEGTERPSDGVHAVGPIAPDKTYVFQQLRRSLRIRHLAHRG